MTPDAFDLTNRLKVLRAERNLTQEAVAELVGVSRKTINATERGGYLPSVLVALKLARVLEVPVEEIFQLDTQRA